MFITFPEEDTLPLSGSIITDHFGIDTACDECGGYGIIGRDCKCVTVPTIIEVIDD